MASRSLRNRLGETTNIWPGFVDVLATLLIVIIFVLMVFTVSQIYLSDASIAENIAFGVNEKNIDFKSVERASKIANLHDFVINEVLEGYNSKVGERGVGKACW